MTSQFYVQEKKVFLISQMQLQFLQHVISSEAAFHKHQHPQMAHGIETKQISSNIYTGHYCLPMQPPPSLPPQTLLLTGIRLFERYFTLF